MNYSTDFQRFVITSFALFAFFSCATTQKPMEKGGGKKEGDLFSDKMLEKLEEKELAISDKVVEEASLKAEKKNSSSKIMKKEIKLKKLSKKINKKDKRNTRVVKGKELLVEAKIGPSIIEARPSWFNAPRRFSSKTRLENIASHPFFDLNSRRKKGSPILHYYLITPVESQFGYEFNLYSGTRFKRFNYCKQNDVWENYSSRIERPPFSEGLIPRLLDQTGSYQRIWVFGGSEYLKRPKAENSISQEARVIGGVVLQYCNDYPCKGRNKWVGRLILLAVNDTDPDMKNVRTINDLKREIDWNYVKAFAENGYGRNTAGAVDEPAYRLVGKIQADKAIDHAFSKGHLFSFKELSKMRKNCYHLYDYIWKSVTEVRENVKKQKNDKGQNRTLEQGTKRINRLKRARARNVFLDKDSRREESRTKKDSIYTKDYATFFRHYSKKYESRFRICQKFVKASDIRDNRERHWIFAYWINFSNLEKIGYYYHCSNKAWLSNPVNSNGVRRFDPKNRICSNESLNQAYEKSITMMTGLANSGRGHYYYKQYDSGIGGTKEKVYSWVFSNGKELNCGQEKRKTKSEDLFPQDVSWDKFETIIKLRDFDVIR